ncbi:MAG TPA: ISAzo13 family transposase, partial [Lysobacter sp.]|nr:ISAzo13 family transposase [Lysobacter sp.]
MVDETRLRQRFEAVRGQLDERGLRLMAAAEARAAGYGGIAAVARATGIARSTIGRGLADLDQPALPPGQVRRAGSGRKPVQEKDPTLLADLRRLVEPATHGDPMRPLLWVSKAT